MTCLVSFAELWLLPERRLTFRSRPFCGRAASSGGRAFSSGFAPLKAALSEKPAGSSVPHSACPGELLRGRCSHTPQAGRREPVARITSILFTRSTSCRARSLGEGRHHVIGLWTLRASDSLRSFRLPALPSPDIRSKRRPKRRSLVQPLGSGGVQLAPFEPKPWPSIRRSRHSWRPMGEFAKGCPEKASHCPGPLTEEDGGATSHPDFFFGRPLAAPHANWRPFERGPRVPARSG